MLNGRIFFNGNPWPEGHPIKKFELIAREINGDVWFAVELQSENYYSERNIDDDENTEYASDWEAPIVWGNFHRCSVSTDESQGFIVCALPGYNKEFLEGLNVIGSRRFSESLGDNSSSDRLIGEMDSR